MLLLLLAACLRPAADDRATYGDDTASGDETGDDTGAETGEAEVYPWRGVEGVQTAESPAVGGGIDVTWTGEDDARYFLEFGYDERYGTVAPVEPGEDPHAVVLGMKPKSLVHARVITVIDGEIFAGDDFTFTVPALPEGFPKLSLLVPADAALDPHFTLLTLFSGANGKSSVFAVDADGDVVWWAENEAMFVPGAHVRPDRSGIVYRVDDQWGLTFGEVVSVDFDGAQRVVHEDDYGHHDTFPHEDGTVATFVTDVRSWGGEDVAGDTLVEIAPDGSRRVVWSSWDTLDPAEDTRWMGRMGPFGADWTHANGMDYDAETDTYLVSLYSLGMVVNVARGNGALNWRLGGGRSDFRFVDDTGFDPAHAPVFADGGLWLFDNHSNFMDNGEDGSRVVRYALDESTGSASLEWEWFDTQTRLMTDVMGDVRPLAGGNLLTTWGTIGRAAILSEDGQKLWEIQADPGMVIGRGDVFTSFYGPSPVVVTGG